MKMTEEMALARKAARAAGDLILSQSRNRKIVGFKSKVDFVTNVDKNSEKLITSMIKKRFPGHGIMAEEGTNIKGRENLWIIDPLDGTINFMHGYPFFCVSIALIRNGKQALGVVYDPLRKEMFHAVAGGGAYLNGKRISVSKTKEMKDSLISTGFYHDIGDGLVKKTLEKIDNLVSTGVQGIRRGGSAALDMCYLAYGRIDGYWIYALSPWDFAAASLIAREAGATITTPRGGRIEIKKNGIVAANRHLYDKLFRAVRL
jgi:myo-inositol-1(or 4)-monophosphatase